MSSTLQIYYSIVFFTMVYAFSKLGINKISVLVILIFWEGLFNYLGDITHSLLPINIGVLFNLILVLYTFFIYFSKVHRPYFGKEKVVDIIFIIFTFSFWISYFINKGNIITLTNQYFYKYFMIYILYYYIINMDLRNDKLNYLKKTLLTVLYIQVFLSIIKILLFGFGVEPIVGSMSSGGAGLAVVIPIISLIFYWINKKGMFKRKDWFILLLFIFISLASGKRQPVLLYPLFLFILIVYVKKERFKILSTIKYIPLVFILIYFGVRLTPSLTNEGKMWGSFELSYVIRYALKYYTGETSINSLQSSITSYNRIGALDTFFNPKTLSLNNFEELLFGKGLYNVVSGKYGRFEKTFETGSDFGIDNIGLVGGSIKNLYALGYIGTISVFILGLSIIGTLNNKRIRLILIIYYIWDFLLYYNQMIYSNQSAVIVFFIIHYLNISYKKSMYNEGYLK